MIEKKDKKMLLFGNGISVRFTNNEYKYESIKKRFVDNLKFLIDNNEDSNYTIFQYIENDIQKCLMQEFNESTFFKIYKIICLKMIEKKYGGMQDYKSRGYISPENVWNMYYNQISKHDESSIDNFAIFAFKQAHDSLNKAISMSICINDNFNDWININYSEKFINHLSEYENIFTTNYYVGNLKNVKFLHGEVIIENKDMFVLPRGDFDIRYIANQCIEKTQILFGENYIDKVFLYSMLSNPYSSKLVKRHSVFKEDDFYNGTYYYIDDNNQTKNYIF